MRPARTLLGVLIDHVDVRRSPRHALRARDRGLRAVALLRGRLALVAPASLVACLHTCRCDVAAL